MNICLFKPEELGSPLDLRDERVKHILTVLHKGEGDCFAAGIIGGASGTARIERIETRQMTAPNGKNYRGGSMTFSFVPEGDGKPLYPLIMLIGFPRPIQLKRLLRDMAGLGVCSVYLSGTDLGEKSYLKSTLCSEEACHAMLLEGTVQAAGTHVPRVKICPDRATALAEIREEAAVGEQPEGQEQTGARGETTGREEAAAFTSLLKFGKDNVRPEESLACRLDRDRDRLRAQGCGAVSAIGSERGWTDTERDLLARDGFSLLSMGKRVLRTETAATVSASLILAAMGKL